MGRCAIAFGMNFFLVLQAYAAMLVPAVADAETIPLFRELPSLERAYPRVPLVTEPTPVEPLDKIAPNLWVKRDDRSDQPLGGNKARKLEFILGETLKRGSEFLVTCGMYGSNHALATALVAKQQGLRSILILGPQPVTEDVREKLLAFHALGAVLRYHGTKLGMGLEMLQYQTKAEFSKRFHFVGPGGSTVEGMLGYVNAFFELVDQLGREGLPKRIVLPAGTGGTMAGLLVGSCLAGVWEKVRIEGVGVADPLLTGEGSVRSDAHNLYSAIVGRLSRQDYERVPRGCDFLSSSKALKYLEDYYDPGYGEAKPGVFEAIKLLKETHNIVLERTYTGKAMRYLLDTPSPEKTLFWLTYNAYDLRKIIDGYKWKYPNAPWRELPEDFWPFFESPADGRRGK
jgi:D-cysteine desulfhydrase